MSEALTTAESVRLIELERVIDRGKTAFLETGNALAEIRASQLYRVSHATFEAYFQERLGLEKSHVQRLMAAAKAVEEISKTSPMGEVPKSERQARPLTKLPADQQPAAWEKAVEKAAEEGKPVTARHVEEAVAETYPTPHHGALSEDAEAKGDEAEKDSENLWLLKSTWRKAAKKDRAAFLQWVKTQ